jgi:hypothetical protein
MDYFKNFMFVCYWMLLEYGKDLLHVQYGRLYDEIFG